MAGRTETICDHGQVPKEANHTLGQTLYHVHKRRSLLDAERRLRLVDEQLLYHKRGGSNLYCI